MLTTREGETNHKPYTFTGNNEYNFPGLGRKIYIFFKIISCNKMQHMMVEK